MSSLSLNKRANRAVISTLVLTFSPSQPRRKLSLSGGSAAKVFEPRSQKINSKQQKWGEFFAAHPAGSTFGNSGMRGSPFLWLLSFGEAKESNLPPATPANGQQPIKHFISANRPFDRLRANGSVPTTNGQWLSEGLTINAASRPSTNWIASILSQ